MFTQSSYSRLGSDAIPIIDILLFHPSHVDVPVPKLRIGSTIRGLAPIPFRPVAHASNYRGTTLQDTVIDRLEDIGLLGVTLTVGPSKWTGVTLMPTKRSSDSTQWCEIGDRLREIRAVRGTYRRLNLRCVWLDAVRVMACSYPSCSFAPMKSRGAAMLLLTGDTDFTRSLRIKAASLGMYLNEYGLWRWHPFRVCADPTADGVIADADESDNGESGQAEEDGHYELIESESEEKILELLDQGWVDPEKRNFRFLKAADRSVKRGPKPRPKPSVERGPGKRGPKPKYASAP
jgi:DNA polymerase beta